MRLFRLRSAPAQQLKDAKKEADKAFKTFEGHLGNLQLAVEGNEELRKLVIETEAELTNLGTEIDSADKNLASVRSEIAEKFKSLSAVFNSLCDKVEKAGIPTTAKPATKEEFSQAFKPI